MASTALRVAHGPMRLALALPVLGALLLNAWAIA